MEKPKTTMKIEENLTKKVSVKVCYKKRFSPEIEIKCSSCHELSQSIQNLLGLDLKLITSASFANKPNECTCFFFNNDLNKLKLNLFRSSNRAGHFWMTKHL